MKKFLAASIVAHALSICVIHLQKSKNPEFQFEDIDYTIFTEGAEMVSKGKSPYRRETYRYTPLISIMLLPTVYFRDFGKILFSICSILTGVLIYKMLLRRNVAPKKASYLTGILWLCNPLIVIISTRGNLDGMSVFFVVLCFYLLGSKKEFLSAVIFGFAVHTRFYPIIYTPAIFYYLTNKSRPEYKSTSIIRYLLTSTGVFIFFLGVFYHKYGYEFIYESYLYHIVRIDYKHNLSANFYPNYISLLEKSNARYLLTVLNWVSLGLIAKGYSRADFMLSILLQTILFVATSQVFTFQYFVWYYVFIPFIGFEWRVFLPIISSIVWIYFSYGLEFKGKPYYTEIWASSLLMYTLHIYFLISFLLKRPSEQSNDAKIK